MTELSCSVWARFTYSAEGFLIGDVPGTYHIIFYNFIFNGADFRCMEKELAFLIINKVDLRIKQRERLLQELCGRGRGCEAQLRGDSPTPSSPSRMTAGGGQPL